MVPEFEGSGGRAKPPDSLTPRFVWLTRDVDAMVVLDEGKWGEFLSAGERLGFVPRLPDPLGFARKARVLLVRHEATGIDVDVVFGGLRFEEEAVERASWVEVSGIRVPLPTPEDLIIV